jgi:hypothetical protein
MLASAHREPCSHDALPVCLREENPHRLVSLWDIVNEFRAVLLVSAYRSMKHLQSVLECAVGTKGGGHLFEGKTDEVRKCFDRIGRRCSDAGFTLSAETASISSHDLGLNGERDCSTLVEKIKHVEGLLTRDLFHRRFLTISQDRAKYLENDMLFGPRVHSAFVSARRDIKEAGNSLAAECNTGAVFHLMRAVEFGLRALAKDRRIEFVDKPLEQKEWGQILSKLESLVKELRAEDGKKWTSQVLRESQIRFYSELVQELRSFNDVWRRHVSHADVNAFYDRDQAFSTFNHTKAFMEKLATMISEDAVTPIYWEEESK